LRPGDRARAQRVALTVDQHIPCDLLKPSKGPFALVGRIGLIDKRPGLFNGPSESTRREIEREIIPRCQRPTNPSATANESARMAAVKLLSRSIGDFAICIAFAARHVVQERSIGLPLHIQHAQRYANSQLWQGCANPKIPATYGRVRRSVIPGQITLQRIRSESRRSGRHAP
jgi:hypothetical protein